VSVRERIWRDEAHWYVRSLPKCLVINNRGCSQALQRVLSDFGLEHSFAQAAARVREHYGFAINKSAVASQSHKHARAIRALQDARKPVGALPAHGAKSITAEADGTMIPTVTCQRTAKGGRKRLVEYREVRLCAARCKGSATAHYEAGLRGVEQTGNLLGQAARAGGWGLDSHLHGVGDGAEWIRDQFQRLFGGQGRYLIDFFHLCEYLAEASQSCNPDKPALWMRTQKKRLKSGHANKVIQTLEAHLEHESIPDELAPVRRAHRYMRNRPGNFFYDQAIAENLEIGSGLIESGHRHVLQARLKIPGAAWSIDSADAFAQARAFRANGQWDSYWKRNRAA